MASENKKQGFGMVQNQDLNPFMYLWNELKSAVHRRPPCNLIDLGVFGRKSGIKLPSRGWYSYTKRLRDGFYYKKMCCIKVLVKACAC